MIAEVGIAGSSDTSPSPVISQFRLRRKKISYTPPGAAHDVFEFASNEIDLGVALEELVAMSSGNSFPVIRSRL
ncbi:hypothetical protein I6F15_27495 [Bradyrhizobium sp. BRP14]|nr:hypothetical protein [Bradyrhizobium sp. BRP14]